MICLQHLGWSFHWSCRIRAAGIRRGQHSQSAMAEPRPGWTTFMIMVSPLPGKYELYTCRVVGRPQETLFVDMVPKSTIKRKTLFSHCNVIFIFTKHSPLCWIEWFSSVSRKSISKLQPPQCRSVYICIRVYHWRRGCVRHSITGRRSCSYMELFRERSRPVWKPTRLCERNSKM